MKRFLIPILLLVGSLRGETQSPTPTGPPAPSAVIRAGTLVDPQSGTASSNQTIVVENGKVTAIGPSLRGRVGSGVEAQQEARRKALAKMAKAGPPIAVMKQCLARFG